MIGTRYAKGAVWSEEARAARSKPVVELTSGRTFKSLISAAGHYGMDRPNVIRAIKNGAPLKRGPNAGLHFAYPETGTLLYDPD